LTSTELIKSIIIKVGRYKYLIIIIGISISVLMFFYAKSKNPVYSTKATVYPLTAATDNGIGGSAISGILGIEGSSKSFSSEAAINIIELSFSRTLLRRVAAARIPQLENKTISELLIAGLNKHKSFFSELIMIPKDSLSLVIQGSQILQNGLDVKMGKNGILEVSFISTDIGLLTPVTNMFINKLSQFYIDLKISKVRADYNFTIKKTDSLDLVINAVDKKAIGIQNSTFFASPEKLEYTIPKEDVSIEKSRLLRQRDISVNNREEARWRLQRITPIIAVLDPPTEPFGVTVTSSVTYSVIGFLLGAILSILFLISGLVYKYTKAEINKSFFEEEKEEDTLNL